MASQQMFPRGIVFLPRGSSREKTAPWGITIDVSLREETIPWGITTYVFRNRPFSKKQRKESFFLLCLLQVFLTVRIYGF
jgi:hypothetical protein